MEATLEKSQIYYQDEYMTIAKADHAPLILFKAVGLPKNSEHFREEFNLVLDFIFSQSKLHPRLILLGDLREVQTIIDEDMQYLCETFYPRVDQSNLKKLALLTPNSVFSQIALEALFTRIKVVNMTIRVFDEVDKAMEWLQEI